MSEHVQLSLESFQSICNETVEKPILPLFAGKAIAAGALGLAFLAQPMAAEASTEVDRTDTTATVVLSKGETVVGELRKQGYTTPQALAKLPEVEALSNLDADKVRAGIDKVVLPIPPANSSPAGEVKYRIQPEDTLTKIAREHGTTIAAIVAVNPAITDPNLIRAGKDLIISAPAAPAVEKSAASAPAPSPEKQPPSPIAVENPAPAPVADQSPKLVTVAPPKKAPDTAPSTTLPPQPQPPKVEAAPPTTAPAPKPEIALPTTAPAPKVETTPPTTQPSAPKAETAPAVAPTQPPAAEVKMAPPLPSSKLNIANIKPMYGAEAVRIQDTVRYLVDKHGFSPKGAAYLAGSGLMESWLKTDVTGDQGEAKGLFGMTHGRAEGMPQDFYGQIDHAVNDMTIDQISVKKLVLQTLRDANASDNDVQLAIRWFERYNQNDDKPKDGIPDGQGRRFEFGAQIYSDIMTIIPAPTAPAEAAKPPVTTAPPTTAPPSTTIAPTTTAPPTTKAPTTTLPPTAQAPKLETQNAAAEHDKTQEIIAGFKHPYINKLTVTIEENGTATVEVKGEKVSIYIAQQLAEMVEASERDGINLIVFDGFRTKEEQLALRKINGCPNIWTSQPKDCKVETAKPGESNHEHDTGAIDFRYQQDGVIKTIENRSNPAFLWLKDNAKNYGFKNLPSEAWHWSPKGN